MYRIKFHASIVAFILSMPCALDASEDSNGPNGINSIGLQDAMGNPLTGLGVDLGQVERLRPGKPVFDTDAMCCNADVDPTGVFVLEMNANSNQEYGEHALWVAGVMISKDTNAPMGHSPPTGVSPDASLYSSAHTNTGILRFNAALASQQVATVADVRAINLSFGLPLEGGAILDGFSHYTQFLDWSASTFQHDVLYVVAGNGVSAPGGGPVPTENYNGMTVAASGKIGDVGKFRQVSLLNDYSMDAVGTRTSTDILAPGLVLDLAGVNGTFPTPPDNSGTSFAAPHVTGTVGLLQQYANERIMNVGGPNWKPDPMPGRNAPARRHEVMKAVLMNSADKIEGIIGMERTVLMQGSTTMNWFDSPAANNPAIPLDLEMGAGHLNANRALQQFSPGETDVVDVGNVPLIGWDLGKVELDHPIHKYVFDQPLQENDYVSITLAWDRDLALEFDDGPTPGAYDAGETFSDFGIVNVDLYLLPAGATDTSNPIKASTSSDSNLEHIFAEIPTTGNYEFWVQMDDPQTFPEAEYGLAWWAGPTVSIDAQGDYDGNGTVGPEDYTAWRSSFGSTTELDADGNGDQVNNAADYVIWRDNLGASSGSGSLAAVPEPSSLLLLALPAIFFRRRSPRR